MKAAFLLEGAIRIGTLDDPVPGPGQALVRTHKCGLCASDAHFVQGGAKVFEDSRKFGGPYADLDFGRIIVPGHEYVGEIVDYGPGSARSLKIGTRVTSCPIMRAGGSRAVIGHSHDCPGGFGELMLLDETFLMAVPEGLPDEMAALVEPLALALEHARVGEPTRDDVPLVVGCGAIGLAVIAGLRLMGIAPIVAADFDAGRRALALKMGADIVVDPRTVSPYEPMADLDGG